MREYTAYPCEPCTYYLVFKKEIMYIVPPHDILAEQSLLWCIIIEPTLLLDCTVLYDEFYDERCQLIFKTIKEVQKNWLQIDMITVSDFLQKNNNLEKIWGNSYLVELTELVPITTHFNSYVELIKEKENIIRIIKRYHLFLILKENFINVIYVINN